jgi:putative tricarboxylic transport membrane protein
MTRRGVDFVLGLGSIALAAVYWAIAARIPESLLSDSVGATGFPSAIALALAITGALLALRSARDRIGNAGPIAWREHARAAGLLAILAAYVMVMPLAGYPVTLAVLVGAVAAYAGARGAVSLIVTSALAGVLFWLAFAKLLGVAMPLGSWMSGG